MKNKIEFRCTCGYSENITYYDFLSGGEFDIGQPIPLMSPFISEAIYEETISITPITLTRKCPVCGEEMIVVFPLSLEDTVTILQSEPPDAQMYG